MTDNHPADVQFPREPEHSAPNELDRSIIADRVTPTFDEQPEWLGSQVNEEAREQARRVMEERMGLSPEGELPAELPWSDEEIAAGEAQRFADEQRERADALGDALVAMTGSLAMMAQTMKSLGDLASAAAEAAEVSFETIRTNLEGVELSPEQVEGLEGFGIELGEDGTIEFTSEVDERGWRMLAAMTEENARAVSTPDAAEQDEENAR